MYTAGAQHSSSRLSLWRPAAQEKLLLCVDVAGPWWASPEKRSRPAHGWKGRPRSWQRSASWYQAFFFFSLVPGARWYPTLNPRQSFCMWYIIPHTKTKIIAHVHEAHGHTRTDFFFGMYQLETRFARIISVILLPRTIRSPFGLCPRKLPTFHFVQTCFILSIRSPENT